MRTSRNGRGLEEQRTTIGVIPGANVGDGAAENRPPLSAADVWQTQKDVWCLACVRISSHLTRGPKAAVGWGRPTRYRPTQILRGHSQQQRLEVGRREMVEISFSHENEIRLGWNLAIHDDGAFSLALEES